MHKKQSITVATRCWRNDRGKYPEHDADPCISRIRNSFGITQLNYLKILNLEIKIELKLITVQITRISSQNIFSLKQVVKLMIKMSYWTCTVLMGK